MCNRANYECVIYRYRRAAASRRVDTPAYLRPRTPGPDPTNRRKREAAYGQTDPNVDFGNGRALTLRPWVNIGSIETHGGKCQFPARSSGLSRSFARRRTVYLLLCPTLFVYILCVRPPAAITQRADGFNPRFSVYRRFSLIARDAFSERGTSYLDRSI